MGTEPPQRLKTGSPYVSGLMSQAVSGLKPDTLSYIMFSIFKYYLPLFKSQDFISKFGLPSFLEKWKDLKTLVPTFTDFNEIRCVGVAAPIQQVRDFIGYPYFEYRLYKMIFQERHGILI